MLLVVEDDPSIAGHLVRGLKRIGYGVELMVSGDGVRERVLALKPDLVVLDLMLPGLNGFDVLELLREVSEVPVIVLTAKRELSDRLKSFELGATDFMTKPYFIEELVARIRVRLPAKNVEAPTICFGDVAIDPEARAVRVGGALCDMTRHELDILLYLTSRPGRAVQRSTLVNATLSALDDRNPRVIDVHISRIRQKIGTDAAAHIVTIRGLGYRFDEECAR